MKKIKSEETTTGAIAPSRYASMGATDIKGNYINHANREDSKNFIAWNKQRKIREERRKKLMINSSTKRANSKNESINSLERIYDLVLTEKNK